MCVLCAVHGGSQKAGGQEGWREEEMCFIVARLIRTFYSNFVISSPNWMGLQRQTRNLRAPNEAASV
jgi:hypothetical protein